MDWSALLRDLRLERGLSQRALCREAKINRSTLRRMENGETSIDLPTFEAVLSALGHELDVLPFRAVPQH